MNTAPMRPALHGPAHGATALGTDSTGRHTHPARTRTRTSARPHHPLRRRTGDALRAVRVFAGAAFGVVVLGTAYDSTAHDAPADERPGERHSGRHSNDEAPYRR